MTHCLGSRFGVRTRAPFPHTAIAASEIKLDGGVAVNHSLNDHKPDMTFD